MLSINDVDHVTQSETVTSRRDDVVAAVRARTPVDDREQRCIAELLAASNASCDPFDEHANPVHVTASRSSSDAAAWSAPPPLLGVWVAPGGHIDAGEQWEAAVREAREETGLQHITLANGSSTLLHVDVHRGPRGHTHLDLRYLLDGDDADPAPPPDESQDVFWFTWPEALRIVDPSMTGILTHLSRRP